MYHPLRVRVAECPGDLAEDAGRLIGAEWTIVADPLPQRPAGDVPHHEVDEPFAFGDRVDRDDVRMGKSGCGTCLAEEPLAEGRLGGEDRREELDGHRTIECDVPREVHHTHPAPPQLVIERVLAGEDALELEEELVRSLRHSSPTSCSCSRLHRQQGNPR